MLYHLISIVILIFLSGSTNDYDKEIMVSKVNMIRTSGCICGGKKMQPVKEVVWNNTLYETAFSHAEDMKKHRYFSHFSRKGEDVGERVDKFNYKWMVIGENIAEGQRNFDQALEDWVKSPSHCKMIMDPKVDEMGIARSGNYWVQHFGKRSTRSD